MQPVTAPINSIRSFRSWWIRDLQHSWIGLFAVTMLLLFTNILLFFGISYLRPDLGSLFTLSSFSAAIRLGVQILGDPVSVFGAALLYLLVNTFFITWIASILKRRIEDVETNETPSLWSRYLSLLSTSLPALFILIAIILSGGGLAYALSRWYFGAVLPIIVLTFFFFMLFSLWFAYVPFVVIWKNLRGTRALSLSRRYARQSRLRLFALFAIMLVICYLIATELDGLQIWLRSVFILITLPAIVSLLATLFAETQSKHTSGS